MKKRKRLSSVTLTIWFLFVIIFLSAWNMDRFAKIASDDIKETSETGLLGDDADNTEKLSDKWETYYKRYFRFMEPLAEVVGASHLVLGKMSIDNYSYVKDPAGNLQLIEDNFDKGLAEEKILAIADAFGDRDIPLLYVSMPPRFDAEDFPLAQALDFYGQHEDQMLDALSAAGLYTLDTGQALKNAGQRHLYPFKTDIHLETAGEVEAARLIAEELSTLGAEVSNQDIIFDRNNYTVETYDFGGNLIRSSGILYIGGLDDFELWFPDFETDLTVNNPPEPEEPTRQGPFAQSVMNRMDPNTTTAGYTLYWVVDYLRHGSPYYTIDNNLNEEGCRLLFIIDSYAYRAVSYLSLGAAHITVIDPRRPGSGKYLKDVMENGEYDAVIIAAGGKEFYEKINLS